MPNAIETEYAGCRFRSRLEARWAVFFDAMNIRWEYEPEGFNVNHRLSNQPGSFRYLPDFRLPDFNLWVEVKGAWSNEECLRFLDAVASLADSSHGFLICGPFLGGAQNWPWHLHMYKGDVYMSTWDPTHVGRSLGRGIDAEVIATDFGGDLVNVTDGHLYGVEVAGTLLRGSLAVRLPLSQVHSGMRALTDARSARFEHGQSGALRPPMPPEVSS